jgi:hypothetical protein
VVDQEASADLPLFAACRNALATERRVRRRSAPSNRGAAHIVGEEYVGTEVVFLTNDDAPFELVAG